MRRFAQKAMAITMAAALMVSTVPAAVLAADDGNYGDDIELDVPSVYPESALENISSREIETKVDALLATMTEEEMYNMLGGTSTSRSPRGYGTGYNPGVARLGVPILRMYDGPKGVISNYILETTSPASELALASSFNESVAYDYGKLTGSDNKASAGNVQLGAQLDIVRAPFFQRSRDSLGEDGYLTSKMGYQLTTGIEDENVIATLKHMACYSETDSGRNSDVVVDEQTLHELYLYAYEYIVKNNGAHAIMSSYNMINGVAAASSEYVMKTVLRDMWGFTGFVMSDWGGNYGFSVGTLDMEMPSISSNNQQNIENAIAAGTLSWDDVVESVRRILTAYGEVGYLGLVEVKQNGTAAEDPNDPDPIELNEALGEDRDEILAENNEIALESSVEGSVLLKNDNSALPVSADDSIAIIGLLGNNYLNHISESSYGALRYMTGPYDEMVNILGEDADITYATGLDTLGEPVDSAYLYVDEDCTANGVNMSVTTDGVTEESVIDSVRLTTGTIDGEVNRTYKNSEDGTALVAGQTATMTTYLKVEESGNYELFTEKIGGNVTITINGQSINGSGNASQSGNNWPSTGTVPTQEGMDVPTSTTTMYLEAGQAYQVNVTVTAVSAAKDTQLSLNWFKPGDRDAQYAEALEAAAENEKVIVFAYDKGENRKSKQSMDLEDSQLALLHDVIDVAKANGNQVIVVLETGLPVTMDWLDDVDAVLEMWLAGQAGGEAAAQLLTGVENPSGKLPVSWPADINDTQYGDFATGYTADAENNLDYYNGGEGIYSGYRWYDYADIDPLYCFGYGLSYTTFEYSDLRISRADDGYYVTFTVTNTGDVAGAEAAQVYLGAADVPEDVQMAEYKLAAFGKTAILEPGESETMTLKVEERELSYWDVTMESEDDEVIEKWRVAEGDRTFNVGASHDDLYLTQTVYVEAIETNTVKASLESLYKVWADVDLSRYTAESAAAMQAALDYAEDIINNVASTQEDYDEAVSELIAAYSGLEWGVQKLHLEVAIQAANALDSSLYSNIGAVTAAVAVGQTVLYDANATQEEVNEAAYAILDAMADLNLKDAASLESLIESAEALLDGPYTDASLAALEDAINAAKDALVNSSQDSDALGDAYRNLINAIIDLDMIGDKAALKAMIDKANDILANADAYVASTIDGLDAVLEAATYIYNKEQATQSEIDTQVEDLTLEIAKARLMGDVDGNGVITTSDAVMILQYAAEMIDLDDTALESADVNRDGGADSSDAVLVLQYAAEMISAF